MGFNEPRKMLQIEEIDEALSNAIWNHIIENFFLINELKVLAREEKRLLSFSLSIWREFFGKQIDDFPRHVLGSPSFIEFRKYLRKWYNSVEWYSKYDFLEYLHGLIKISNLVRQTNNILTAGMSGYRLVGFKIMPIVDQTEIISIEESLEKEFSYVNHLNTSIKLLSDRDNPDFRNSIKESISAVEAICQQLLDNDKITLGQALKQVDTNYNLPDSLKKAFSNLYGYTSSSGGIRHALTKEEVEVTFDEAKFMLVSCSAFINYLKSKLS